MQKLIASAIPSCCVLAFYGQVHTPKPQIWPLPTPSVEFGADRTASQVHWLTSTL